MMHLEPLLGSHEAAVQVLARAGLSSEAQGSHSRSRGCWQNSVSCGRRTEARGFSRLLLRGQQRVFSDTLPSSKGSPD